MESDNLLQPNWSSLFSASGENSFANDAIDTSQMDLESLDVNALLGLSDPSVTNGDADDTSPSQISPGDSQRLPKRAKLEAPSDSTSTSNDNDDDGSSDSTSTSNSSDSTNSTSSSSNTASSTSSKSNERAKRKSGRRHGTKSKAKVAELRKANPLSSHGFSAPHTQSSSSTVRSSDDSADDTNSSSLAGGELTAGSIASSTDSLLQELADSTPKPMDLLTLTRELKERQEEMSTLVSSQRVAGEAESTEHKKVGLTLGYCLLKLTMAACLCFGC
jgi:hypothetical protein